MCRRGSNTALLMATRKGNRILWRYLSFSRTHSLYFCRGRGQRLKKSEIRFKTRIQLHMERLSNFTIFYQNSQVLKHPYDVLQFMPLTLGLDCSLVGFLLCNMCGIIRKSGLAHGQTGKTMISLRNCAG